MTRKALALLVLSIGALGAAQLIVPAAVERDGVVHVLFKTAPLATGQGQLAIEWTDGSGRVVDLRRLRVELNDEVEIGFDLDARRAVAMRNTLHAHLVFDGKNRKGEPDHRDEAAEAAFIAKPPVHTWWDYQILMWQELTPEEFAQFKELGISGGEYNGRARALPEFLLKNDLRWYAENIATDFYSAYHRYFPDRDNGWFFQQARQGHQREPNSLEPFRRHPSLNDREWLDAIHDRLVETARFYSPYRPVFYSLGDETGIGELAAAWDFDLSDQSLTRMREWLKQRYGTLAALNRQWGANWEAWDVVTPMTTDEALQRGDGNYSAWGDFKEWMDLCWANALKMGTDAIHSVDPEAYVGIGGGQMPGWGGYDYSRITQSLTAIEPYDIGNNIEIIRSLNPNMAVMTTAFAHGPWEKQRVWHEALHGNRGLILWDPAKEYLQDRGREAGAYYNELRNGLGALLIASRREADPIAIHYSQPSLRVEWLREAKPRGAAWATRSAKAERSDNEFLRLRESWTKVVEDAGLQANFVSYGQVEQGELLRGGYRVLILPRSSALSAAEARAIGEFAAAGGEVIADGIPGSFDEHGRKLEQPRLADVTLRRLDVLDYHRQRVLGKGSETRDAAAKIFAEAGVRPVFPIADAQGRPVQGIETHIFRNGAVRLVGFLSNPDLRVDELGPPDFRSNENFARPMSLQVSLPEELFVYDVRARKALGKLGKLNLNLDPYEPTIYAVSRAPLPALRVSVPARIAPGETARVAIRFDAPTPAETHVLHVEVTGPDGKLVRHYSGNLPAPAGRALWDIPLAYNDAAGVWHIQVHDLLSGQTTVAAIEVH
jgi:hypothetical protein